MDQDHNTPQAPSLLRRLAALLYDSILLMGVLMLAVLILIVPYDVVAERPYPHADPLYRSLLQLYLLMVLTGYHAFFWTRGGQTLGMRTWRFRVIRNDGNALTITDALRRFAWATLGLLPAGLGLWWCLVDPERLAWYDRMSRTRPVMVPH